MSGHCRLSLNGTAQASSAAIFNAPSGFGSLTIVSAATLSRGGGTIEAECSSGDSTTTANVNLALAKVDNLN